MRRFSEQARLRALREIDDELQQHRLAAATTSDNGKLDEDPPTDDGLTVGQTTCEALALAIIERAKRGNRSAILLCSTAVTLVLANDQVALFEGTGQSSLTLELASRAMWQLESDRAAPDWMEAELSAR